MTVATVIRRDRLDGEREGRRCTAEIRETQGDDDWKNRVKHNTVTD